MLRSLKIEAFKSIVDQPITLSKLNVFTGLNGSGKSSFLQAIRMCCRAFNEQSLFIEGYGGYEELVSNLRRNMPIKFELDLDGNILQIKAKNENVEKSIDSYRFNFDYISADRHGPLSSLPTFPVTSNKISIGERGQFAANFYEYFAELVVNPAMVHHSTSSLTLKNQLNAWMSEISPGVNISAQIDSKHDISHFEIEGFRPANTGFGISYSLPIILATLAMVPTQFDEETTILDYSKDKIVPWLKLNNEKTPILIVENPEAHLHPKGQTALGKFFAHAAMCGLQIIIETHSDHFLDGIRIAIKNRIIMPEDISLYYFEKNSDGSTEIVDIKIDDKGKPNHWPKGFFDQSIINLRELSSR